MADAMVVFSMLEKMRKKNREYKKMRKSFEEMLKKLLTNVNK